MRLGTAQIQITPPVGVELSGYVLRQQPSTGVLDDLWARALYFAHEDERLLWLHGDLLGFDRDWALRLRETVAREAGLALRQVLLTATHSHAGPATVALRECGRPDAAYLRELEDALHDVARAAQAAPQPVTLRGAEGHCELGRDRRAASAWSHTDHRLPVLAFVAKSGQTVAVWANYAMHNVALGHGNRLISGDVAGEAARRVAQALPGAPVVLITNGACGNLNPPELATDPAPMRAYGAELARALLEALSRAEPCAEQTLWSGERAVALDLLPLTAEQVRASAARASAQAEGQPRILRAMAAWRDETLELVRQGAHRQTMMAVHAVRLGPLRLACLGAEVFSRMADELRAALGPHSYVVGYADGDMGYLPVPEVYAEGGYEVEDAFKYYAHFMVAPDSFARARDAAVQLLTR